MQETNERQCVTCGSTTAPMLWWDDDEWDDGASAGFRCCDPRDCVRRIERRQQRDYLNGLDRGNDWQEDLAGWMS